MSALGTPCPSPRANEPRHSATDGREALKRINHFVVIYMENHSFDNLYGLFPGADGLVDARCRLTTLPQVDEHGVPYTELPTFGIFEKLPNQPFDIGRQIPPELGTTDPIHRFYTQQAQLNGGRMDQFVAFSNVSTLSLGYYDTATLPMAPIAEEFTLCDHFFHSAFGGSFLNHQWLVSARTPTYFDAPPEFRILSGMQPNGPKPFPVTSDGIFAGSEDQWVTPDGYAVNTVQSANFHAPGSGTFLPSQSAPTIGDRLSAAGVSWAWYGAGYNEIVAWLKALETNPDLGQPNDFQFHHQAFSYFDQFAPGTAAHAEHMKDDRDFVAAAAAGTLPAVSFVKPLGGQNEHPGYPLVPGQDYAVRIVRSVMESPNWSDTAIILTYDENGGWADHITPPIIDRWGPGARVPAIVISPYAKKHFVDHTQYETVSILATLERRWGLEPLTSRDANANDLTPALTLSN